MNLENKKNKKTKNKKREIFSVSKGLKLIKDSLLEMGNLAKESHRMVYLGLKERSLNSLEVILENEKKINALHIKNDDLCWKILALQSPVAIDLRKVLASVKINGDLERISDQMVNICRNVKKHLGLKDVKWPSTFFKMIEATREILSLTLDAFKKNDLKIAKEVLEKEDTVDLYQDQVIRSLIKEANTTPNSVNNVVTLILITRSLERVGDHATNIAEDVVFISSGKDIRHGHKK